MGGVQNKYYRIKFRHLEDVGYEKEKEERSVKSKDGYRI